MGGLGLFLLGMWLMTEGLKLAAGQALQHILSTWTQTRRRALASGALITAAVQSSSAVTVATIGFVNAGILTLTQAAWVIFGANVGTSTTAWLVALVGFKIKIEALALPLIGIGMALRLSGERYRRGAIGSALAGFGALFLGIELLKSAADGLDALVDPQALQAGGVQGILVFTLVGVLLTALMQSSSAAIAIALTAVAGGLLPLAAGGAMVIGANIGTTITAVLAVLGATPNARRAAAAHVAFNACTAAVAMITLAPMLALASHFSLAIGMEPDAATVLALYHTTFNLLGVVLMWPLSGRLIAFLEQRFRTTEEDESRPVYLDVNVQQVPALALNALALETRRLGTLALALAEQAQRGQMLRPEKAGAVDRIAAAIAGFAARMSQAKLSPQHADALPELLRVARYYDEVARVATEISELPAGAPEDPSLEAALAELTADALAVFGAADTASGGYAADALAGLADQFEQRYQGVKMQLLGAGAHGQISVTRMDDLLQRFSFTRRAVDQAHKAAQRLSSLAAVLSPPAR